MYYIYIFSVCEVIKESSTVFEMFELNVNKKLIGKAGRGRLCVAMYQRRFVGPLSSLYILSNNIPCMESDHKTKIKLNIILSYGIM